MRKEYKIEEYASPEIEELEIDVEQCFAISGEAETEDMEEEEWDSEWY